MVERIAKTNSTVNGEDIYKDIKFGASEYVSFMKKLHKIFLILAVVAKAADDEIRQTVIDTLGVESLEGLEEIVAEACEFSNIDCEVVSQIARTSVWVKEGLKVNTELLKDYNVPK